jgi:(1->4)-alpha-D-glucan 1-alpha-D-glucosylmutase
MLKAVREGKRHSSWITPDQPYESALTAFVGGLLGRVQGNLFLEDLRQTVGLHAWFGALNSLSVTVLKLTSPGVPDIYQGQPMMDLSLVDPDNRRPVDHAAHEDALRALAPLAEAADPAAAVASLLADPGDGRAKLWATWRTLQLRREQPELFEQGDYRPLGVRGARAHNAIAYARRFGPQVLVVAAGRLYAGPGADAGTPPVGRHWSDGVVELDGLPARLTLRNVLTGEVLQPVEGRLPLAMVFASWPVAVLHGEARA